MPKKFKNYHTLTDWRKHLTQIASSLLLIKTAMKMQCTWPRARTNRTTSFFMLQIPEQRQQVCWLAGCEWSGFELSIAQNWRESFRVSAIHLRLILTKSHYHKRLVQGLLDRDKDWLGNYHSTTRLSTPNLKRGPRWKPRNGKLCAKFDCGLLITGRSQGIEAIKERRRNGKHLPKMSKQTPRRSSMVRNRTS